jgi:hypothetical protein
MPEEKIRPFRRARDGFGDFAPLGDVLLARAKGRGRP